jgi:hypothetical protein
MLLCSMSTFCFIYLMLSIAYMSHFQILLRRSNRVSANLCKVLPDPAPTVAEGRGQALEAADSRANAVQQYECQKPPVEACGGPGRGGKTGYLLT